MAKVFISYSHQDEGWKNRVVKQLGVLASEGLEAWDDRRIEAGNAWEEEIGIAIANCDVALLLTSANFLTSKFILGKEVPRLLQRRQTQGVLLIPVILSPCQWLRIPWLDSIQARPTDGKALSGMSEHDAEESLSALAGEIADLTATQSPRIKEEEGKSEQAKPAAKPGSSLQSQLSELLGKCWLESDFAGFAETYKPGREQVDYFRELCDCAAPHPELLELRVALSQVEFSNIQLAPEVSNAIALSALVLYERYSVLQGGTAGNLAAGNLLLAAVQASARHGTDAVVRGSDAEDGQVANAAALPGEFIPFRKDGETEPEWEEIKRSLNVSAESALWVIGKPSHRAMREQFAVRRKDAQGTQWNISDADLRNKLQSVKKALGGQFVFFVDHADSTNLLRNPEYKDRIEREFGVHTVIWLKEKESHDVARQINEIFALLYRRTPAEDKSTEPSDAGPKTVGAWEQLNDKLEKANKTAEQGGKLIEAGTKIVEKAGVLSTVWHALRTITGY